MGGQGERTDPGLSAFPLLAGIAAMVVGIAGVLLAQSTRLNATKLLEGGVYLPEPDRLVLTVAGIAVALVGLVVVVVAIINHVVPRGLMAVGALATTLFAVYGGQLYAGSRGQSTTTSSSVAAQCPAGTSWRSDARGDPGTWQCRIDSLADDKVGTPCSVSARGVIGDADMGSDATYQDDGGCAITTATTDTTTPTDTTPTDTTPTDTTPAPDLAMQPPPSAAPAADPTGGDVFCSKSCEQDGHAVSLAVLRQVGSVCVQPDPASGDPTMYWRVKTQGASGETIACQA